MMLGIFLYRQFLPSADLFDATTQYALCRTPMFMCSDPVEKSRARLRSLIIAYTERMKERMSVLMASWIRSCLFDSQRITEELNALAITLLMVQGSEQDFLSPTSLHAFVRSRMLVPRGADDRRRQRVIRRTEKRERDSSTSSSGNREIRTWEFVSLLSINS